MHTRMHMHAHTHTPMHSPVHTHTDPCTPTKPHARIHADTHTCTHTCIITCTDPYTHAHAHTHVHGCIHAFTLALHTQPRGCKPLAAALAAAERGRAAFQHRPARPGEDAASRRAACGTRRGSGWRGCGEGEHPEPGLGTPRLSAGMSWHGRPSTPWHNLVCRCFQNQQRAKETGESWHFPAARRGSGTRRAMAGGCQDPPGSWHSSVQTCSQPSPSPGTRRPPAGAGQRCRWVCRPAPGSPRSSKPAALQRMEQ